MNKTAQFTPGPWVVNTFIVNGQHKLEVLDATGANACVQANATLIAAAPAMYAALREAEKHLTDLANYGSEGIPEPLLVSVRSAIAQAEGE